VQRTGNRGGVERNHQWVTRWGKTAAMVRSLCELEWQKEEGRGELSRRGGVRATVPTRKEKREGVQNGSEDRNREPTGVPEKRDIQCKGRGECGAMPRPREHGTHGPRHRRLPQNMQLQRPGKCRAVIGHRGDVKSGVPITPDHWWLSFPCRSLLSSFFLLNPTCVILSYRLRSRRTCFFQNPTISVTFVGALLHQLIVDFPLEHQDVFTKENICSKSGTVV
jgi:hypothetical protein